MPESTSKQRRPSPEIRPGAGLAGINTDLGLVVENRCAQAAHLRSIIYARKLHFADALRQLSRYELNGNCALKLDALASGRDPS